MSNLTSDITLKPKPLGTIVSEKSVVYSRRRVPHGSFRKAVDAAIEAVYPGRFALPSGLEAWLAYSIVGFGIVGLVLVALVRNTALELSCAAVFLHSVHYFLSAVYATTSLRTLAIRIAISLGFLVVIFTPLAVHHFSK